MSTRRSPSRAGCARAAKAWAGSSDIDLTQVLDETLSLRDGAITAPGYAADGWQARSFTESGFFPADKPVSTFTAKQRDDLLYKEPTRIKVCGINITYEGLVCRIRKSMLSKEPEALQPHIRAFVERAVVFGTCPQCDGTRLAEPARACLIDGRSIADASAMQISDLAQWITHLQSVLTDAAPLLENLKEMLDAFVSIGLGYLSLERPASNQEHLPLPHRKNRDSRRQYEQSSRCRRRYPHRSSHRHHRSCRLR